MNRRLTRSLFAVSTLMFLARPAAAQLYRTPDSGQPGDRQIQLYLYGEADRLHAEFDDGLGSLEEWQSRRDRWRDEYFYMLGLSPLPERTPLNPTVTGSLEGEGFVVEMLHYQSRPGLYVTGNVYRPSQIKPGERLPAVYYVCGHSNRGRDGNKTAYQSHGMWFARHGYICLVVDSLQLGEIAAVHHGTSRFGRWWWQSRGYTPAGVECWNGIRGIDYLVSRDDVDPNRIAVTGISGGGAATFWIAAADERVTAAVPVSGMADLPSYIGNHVICGHCDCMFLYNTFRWPWTRIAALVAPRPMLFVNSDADPIFPMDANDRVINRLERVYRLYGASDLVDAVVSVGGHAYREDIRKAAYRFINTHLKGDPSPVTDSEVDLVVRDQQDAGHPIPPVSLRVFPTDSDIPADQVNTVIDAQFVPTAAVPLPKPGEFDSWKQKLMRELRRVSFRTLPNQVSAATPIVSDQSGTTLLETERGIRVRLQLARPASGETVRRIILVVSDEKENPLRAEWLNREVRGSDVVYLIEPRGVGNTRWTSRQQSLFYVERSLALLGQTADSGRVRDILAAARYLREKHDGAGVHVAGAESRGVLAAYAALFDSDIAGAIVAHPADSHMDETAPVILNVLRVCDIPDVLGMLAPRPLVIRQASEGLQQRVADIYGAAEAAANLQVRR